MVCTRTKLARLLKIAVKSCQRSQTLCLEINSFTTFLLHRVSDESQFGDIYSMSSRDAGHTAHVGNSNCKELGCWAPKAGHVNNITPMRQNLSRSKTFVAFYWSITLVAVQIETPINNSVKNLGNCFDIPFAMCAHIEMMLLTELVDLCSSAKPKAHGFVCFL